MKLKIDQYNKKGSCIYTIFSCLFNYASELLK